VIVTDTTQTDGCIIVQKEGKLSVLSVFRVLVCMYIRNNWLWVIFSIINYQLFCLCYGYHASKHCSDHVFQDICQIDSDRFKIFMSDRYQIDSRYF